MKLLTKAIEKAMPKLYSTEKTPLEEKKVIVKFFSPYKNWTWYAFEGEKQDDDFLFFGYVCGFEKELGYFSLNELQNCKHGSLPLVERDQWFNPKTVKELNLV